MTIGSEIEMDPGYSGKPKPKYSNMSESSIPASSIRKSDNNVFSDETIKFLNVVSQKKVELHENIVSLTMLSYLTEIKEKYLLTRARQA